MNQNLRRRLTADEMNMGVGMLRAGVSQRQVARTLNVSHSVLQRMWNRFQIEGNVAHLHGGGRSRCTTRAQDRYIVVQARRNRFQNATSLQNSFQNATNVRVSTQTIRNRLHDAGMNARRPTIRIPLTINHVRERLGWAHDHGQWGPHDWATVLFTDESRFCLDFTDRRARVWRRPHERFAPVCIAEHDRYGGGSVMVWGGISLNGKTDLHIVENGTLNAERYCREILDIHVRPYAGAVGPEFILMQDNARPHTARLTKQYLASETIELLPWPARSPDLNPIEHVWDMLQRAISCRPVQPVTIADLRTALIEEWNRIPQLRINRLIHSMPRRCQAVINANGRHTRY